MRLLGLVLLVTLAACGIATESPTARGVDGSWVRLPEGPLSGRTGAGLVGVGGELVVVGGWDFLCPPNADCGYGDARLRDDGAAVDLSTGEWRPIADAPFALRHPVAASVGETVFLLTGCRGDVGCGGAQELLAYDLVADRWELRAPLPGPGGVAALVPVDGGLFAVAGTEEYGERPDRLYDLETDTWRVLPDDPLPATFDRWAVADAGRVLLLGSQIAGVDDEEDGTAADAKVAAALDLATLTWTRLPDAPGGGYQAWDLGDEVWLNAHFSSDGGGVLDLATDTWRPLPAPPDGEAWRGDAAGVIGEAGASYEYANGWVRDTRTNRWLEVPRRTDEQISDDGVTAVGEQLVVFGGARWPADDAMAGGELLAETWVWRPPAA